MISTALIVWLLRTFFMGSISTILGILVKLPWQVWVIIGLAVAGFYLYHKGKDDGEVIIKAQWAAANAAAVQNATNAGNQARAQAEKSVPPVTPEQQAADRARPSVGKPCGVFDPNDRDCAAQGRNR